MKQQIVYRSMAMRFGAMAVAMVFTASQMQAQSAFTSITAETQPAPISQQAQTAPAVPVPSDKADAQSTAALPPANVQIVQADAPQPSAPTSQTESASLNTPINLKALMDQAAQPSQNVQSTAAEQKRQIHPGWLALAAVGLLGAAIGAGGLRGTTDRGLAAGFLVGGLGVAGLSFYLTFK